MPRNSKDGSYYRYNCVSRILNKYLFDTHEYTFLKMCSTNADRDNERRTFIKVVEQTIQSLNPFDRGFIIKEFLKPEENNKFWWVAIYPRSTYYRFRGIAVISFLKLFYEKYKESYGFDYYSII